MQGISVANSYLHKVSFVDRNLVRGVTKAERPNIELLGFPGDYSGGRICVRCANILLIQGKTEN